MIGLLTFILISILCHNSNVICTSYDSYEDNQLAFDYLTDSEAYNKLVRPGHDLTNCRYKDQNRGKWSKVKIAIFIKKLFSRHRTWFSHTQVYIIVPYFGNFFCQNILKPWFLPSDKVNK